MCLFVVLCIPNGYCIFTNTEDKQLLHNSNKKTKQWITFYLAIWRAYARCNPLILSIVNILFLRHVQLIELVPNRIGLIYNNVHVINHFGSGWNLQDLFVTSNVDYLDTKSTSHTIWFFSCFKYDLYWPQTGNSSATVARTSQQ